MTKQQVLKALETAGGANLTSYKKGDKWLLDDQGLIVAWLDESEVVFTDNFVAGLNVKGGGYE